MVIKNINDLVYRIQLGPGLKPKVVHRNRLWKYSGKAPPTWHKQNIGCESKQNQEPVDTGPHVAVDEESGSEEENSGNQPHRSTRARHPPDRYDTSFINKTMLQFKEGKV